MFSFFHQLVPHWSPISCILPSPGRSGPSRAEVCVGFRCVRLVQALPSSPPSAGLVPCPSTLRFSLSLPFQGLPASGQVCWCVFSLSFFCVPLFAFWLSNLSFHFHAHLTFIPPSSSFSPHLPWHHPAKGRVCVWHVCIDVKFHIIYNILTRGVTGVPGRSVTNEDTPPGPV